MANETPIYKKLKDDYKALQTRLNRLEAVVTKMAHFSGNNRILTEFGIERWVPGSQDMKKYKG